MSALFGRKDETTILTPDLEKNFTSFAEEFNNTSKSAQVVAEELGITNQAVVDYAKTQKNGTLTLEGFTNSLNKCSLASRAGQAALKGLAIAGNMLAAWAVAAAVNAVVTGIDNLIHAEQKAKDRMEESVSAYETTKQELSEINSELETQKSRLAELQAKGSLTYAEQEELDKLRQATTELETQKKIKEEMEKQQQEKVVDHTIAAYEKEFSEPVTEETLKSYRDSIDEPGAPLAVYSDESSDLAPRIASYEKLIELQNELKDTDPEQAARYGEIAENVEDSIWKDITSLQEYKKNLSSIPYDELSEGAQKTLDEVSQSMELAWTAIDPSGWNNIQFEDIFSNVGLEKTRTELMQLAQAGTLTPETIQGYQNLSDAIGRSNLYCEDGKSAVQAFVDEIYRLNDESNGLGEGEGYTFDISRYSENIDAVQSTVSTLKNALDSLNSGSLSENDVLDLMQQFPELIPYIDLASEGFGNLKTGLESLIGTSSDALISQLQEAALTISDPEMLNNINSLINALSQVSEVEFNWRMDDTIGMIDSTISEMNKLASLSNDISQNGLVFDSADAWEYAKVFPEILTNAEQYTDGKIKLDEEAVNSAIQGREAELKADLDTKIQELENEKASIIAKRNFAQEQLNLINSISSSDSLASKQAAINKINNAQSAVNAMIQGGMTEAEAYNTAAASMTNDTEAYNQYVALASQNMQNNMDISATESADSVARNISIMKKNIANLGTDWYNVGLTMQNAMSGNPTPFSPSGPVSFGESKQTGALDSVSAKGVISPFDVKTGLPNGAYTMADDWLNEINKQSQAADQDIENQKRQIEAQIAGYDKQAESIDSQINMLKAAKDKGLSAYKAEDSKKRSSGSNTGGSAEKKEEIDNLSTDILDHFEQRRHEIEKVAKSLETYMDNVESAAGKNSFADQLISVNQTLLSDLEKTKGMYQEQADQYLAMLPDNFKELAKNGGVSMTEFIGNTSSEIQEAIKNYQEWAHKVDDIDQELIELKETLKQLQTAKFSNIAEEFERFIEIFDSAKGKIDGIIDLLESQGQKVGEGYYQALIDQSRERISLLEEEREQLKKQMDEALANGIELGSDEWAEMYQKLQGIDQEIIGCYTDIENFQTDIDNLHWDTLDAIADRFSQIQDQLSGLSGLLDIETATKGAQGTEWTDESLTYLGLQTQAYEAGMYQAAQYAKEIEKLKEDYAAGKYSAAEYYEKLADLESKQWDCVDSANAAKDAIRELNEQRVKEATDAIEKEIDAYSDYIGTLKDALSEEKALHDYRNSILEKNRNITATAREINALGASGTASDRASLAKLRQQQNENINSLQEAQYQHDLDARQDALDQELEAYKAMKEAEIEALQNSIASTEVLIGMLLTEGEVMIGNTLYKLTDFLDENGVLQEEKLRASLDARYAMYTQTFEDVKNNTDIVMAGIDLIIQQYGLSIDSSITTPWHNGSAAVAGYGADLTAASSLFIQAIQLVEQEQINLQTEANRSTDAMLRAFGVDTSGLVSRVGSVRSALDQSANASHNLANATASTLGAAYDTSGSVNSIYAIKNEADRASGSVRGIGSAINSLPSSKNITIYVNEVCKLSGGGGGGGGHGPYMGQLQMAKGGVVSGTRDQWLHRALGEDTLAAVRMGERVLTEKQNSDFEQMVRMLPQLLPNIAGIISHNTSMYSLLPAVPAIQVDKIDASLTVQGSVDKTFASQLESAQKDTVNKVTGAIARQLGRVGFRTNAYDMQKI